MNDSIRLRLSWGFLSLAVIHAFLFAVALTFTHRVIEKQDAPKPTPVPPWSIRDVKPRGNMSIEQDQKYSVDANATHEMKFQCGTDGCTPNPASRVRPYTVNQLRPGMVLPDGSVVLNVGPSKPVTPTVDNASPPRPTPAPRPTPKPDNDLVVPLSPTEYPPAKDMQLIMFLGDDDRSMQLVNWFNYDKALKDLKADCEVTTLTANSKLYQSRYSGVISTKSFPAVILQDKDGGHICALGGDHLPRTAAQLVQDINKGMEHYKQMEESPVVNAKNSGRLKTDGYAFDKLIDPNARLDCGPDGCDLNTPVNSGNRPILDTIDKWRNRNKDPLEAFVWMNPTEIATVGFLLLSAIFVIIIAFKRK